MDTDTARIRAFSRTITQRLGVLNDKYLGRNRPLVESRLLYEIGPNGATVRELRARLGLDSGYFSRLLRTLERKRLATTAKRPKGDARVKDAQLTPKGLAELERVNSRSDALVRSWLAPLSKDKALRLVAAMSEVDRLLRASSIEVTRALPQSAEAKRCLEQYFRELASRFPGGFDRDADGARAIQDFEPPQGALLIARLFDEPVGCAALRALDPGIGEIKRMWVSPSVRGLGVGRRLLEELEHIARKRRWRAVRLDTNASLTEAIGLYRGSGYREIGRFNYNPYAQHWFEKTL